MTIPALVLTAGFGTRLDPITRVLAKPAVPLGDRSLIEHVLEWLHRQHVDDVVLNLHYRPATITAILGDGAHLGLSVRYSWEQPILGSAGGPRHALPLLASETFLIVNGDTLCDFDLSPMLAAHVKHGADVTLAVVPNPAPNHYNGIVATDDGVVTGFVPKGPGAAGTWHLVGVQIANARVFEPLPDGVPAETVAGLYRTMAAHTPGRIRVHEVMSSFLDVGTPRDYLDASLRVGVASARGVAASASIVRSVVWPGATVGPDATLEDVIVIGRVDVPAGFAAQSVIIAPLDLARPSDRVQRHGSLALFPLNQEL